jgi:integrase
MSTSEENNVRRPKKTVHYRRTIRIGGKKIEKTFSRSSDAERWYQERKREKKLLESGLALPTSSVSLGEFAMRWLDKRKANGKPQSSWENEESRLKIYIVPQFGHRSLQSILTREWETFLDDLVGKDLVSAGTRNRIRALLSKMYNDAIRVGEVSGNPISIIPQLREPMDRWDYWHSLDDVISYLTHAKNEMPSFSVFASIALNTGARVGEILAFDHKDIYLEQRRIHIWQVFEQATQKVCNRTKGHKSRWLGINDSLFKALQEFRGTRKTNRPNEPLISDLNGERMNEHRIRRIHKRVCKAAGVKSIRIHDLRHTYASHYIMNGGSLAELQGLLGHSSPNMTLKYAHLAPGFLESKASVVSFSESGENVIPMSRIISR